MLNWFRRRIAGPVGDVAEKIRALLDIVSVIWSTLTLLGGNVRRAWLVYAAATQYGESIVGRWAREAIAASDTLAFVYIPRGLSALRTEIRAWAAAQVARGISLSNTAIGVLRAALAVERREARTLIADAILRQHRENAAIAGVARAAWDRVRLIPATADAMVAWILGRMLNAVWRWLLSRGEFLARWLLGHLLAVTLKMLPAIERIIADLF